MKQGSLLGVMRIQPRGSTPPKPRVARRKNSESRPPEWLPGVGKESTSKVAPTLGLDVILTQGFR